MLDMLRHFWEIIRLEVGSLQGLGGNWDYAGKWWASTDGPEDSWDNLLLGRGVSAYYKGVDKWFP
jgi:hypothetical protein